MEKLYDIHIELYASDFRQEVGRLIEEEEVKVIIMGNRRTDPGSEDLQPFTKSSEDWPKFMRVFPILDWKYTEVWSFLRGVELPYCKLYD